MKRLAGIATILLVIAIPVQLFAAEEIGIPAAPDLRSQIHDLAGQPPGSPLAPNEFVGLFAAVPVYLQKKALPCEHLRRAFVAFTDPQTIHVGCLVHGGEVGYKISNAADRAEPVATASNDVFSDGVAEGLHGLSGLQTYQLFPARQVNLLSDMTFVIASAGFPCPRVDSARYGGRNTEKIGALASCVDRGTRSGFKITASAKGVEVESSTKIFEVEKAEDAAAGDAVIDQQIDQLQRRRQAVTAYQANLLRTVTAISSCLAARPVYGCNVSISEPECAAFVPVRDPGDMFQQDLSAAYGQAQNCVSNKVRSFDIEVRTIQDSIEDLRRQKNQRN